MLKSFLLKFSLFLVAVTALAGPMTLLSGCKNGAFTVAPGADPVVVTAEQSISTAWNVVNTFVEFELAHRSSVGPDVTAIADTIRREAPDKFRLARSLMASYKNNRTAENKANLDTALAVVLELSAKVQTIKL